MSESSEETKTILVPGASEILYRLLQDIASFLKYTRPFQACRNKDSEAGGEAHHDREAGSRIASDNSVPAVDKLPALMNYMVSCHQAVM